MGRSRRHTVGGTSAHRDASSSPSSGSGDDGVGAGSGAGADRRRRPESGGYPAGGASQASAAGGARRNSAGSALLERAGGAGLLAYATGGYGDWDATASGAAACAAVAAAEGEGGEQSESEGVFEIRDFTNASSFERITHQVSLAVKKWAALITEGPTEDGGHLLRAEFDHLGFTYELFFQLAPQEVQGAGAVGVSGEGAKASVPSPPVERLGLHSFPTRAHRLQRWFGVQHFATLCVRDHAIDMDSARTVLSALALGARSAAPPALPATLPPLCCFVPIEGTRRRRYVGELVCGGWRTAFATDQRNRVDPSLEHLEGLMKYFWQKLGASPEAPGQALTIGARFTYLADVFEPVCIVTSADGSRTKEEQHPPAAQAAAAASTVLSGGHSGRDGEDAAGGSGEEDEGEGADGLPTEVDTDPVGTMQLHCLWPSFPRGSFVDNAVYSELDPRAAPYWKVRIMQSEEAPLPLTRRLRNLLDFRKEASTVRSAEHSVLPQMPKGALASLSYAIQESLESILLPTAGEMAKLADECLELPVAPPASQASEAASTAASDRPPMPGLAPLRGAARGTRLARLAEISAEMKCFKGAVMLWCQVIMQMRQHWDAVEVVPAGAPSPRTARRLGGGVRTEHFDVSVCLVQQKFEMLQCSIEAKRAFVRAGAAGSPAGLTEAGHEVPARLKASGKPIVSPPLLWPALMTEDMALQRDMVADSISDPTERAELHGREIRSDMAAFKAANAEAALGDFLRWRSESAGGEVEHLTTEPFPKDWLAHTWEETNALPAAQQQAVLFEPEREAEMTLHYLENIEGTQLLLQLVRVLLGSALEELYESAVVAGGGAGCCPHLRMLRDRAVAAVLTAFSSGGRRASTSAGQDEGAASDAAGASGSADGVGGGGADPRVKDAGAAEADAAAALDGEPSRFPEERWLEAAITAAESFEAGVRLAASLRAKLPGPQGEALLDSLLADGEATITSHAQRRLVEELFTRSRALARRRDRAERPRDRDIFESLPYGKEFVLLLQQTANGESAGTKRLYAEIRERHLRLATSRAVCLA